MLIKQNLIKQMSKGGKYFFRFKFEVECHLSKLLLGRGVILPHRFIWKIIWKIINWGGGGGGGGVNIEK